MTLGGCAVSSTADNPLRISLPNECETIAAAPRPVVRPKEDARIAAARIAAWGKENESRLIKRDECEKRVREHYAKGE